MSNATDNDPDDGSVQWLMRHRPAPPEPERVDAKRLAELEAELAQVATHIIDLDKQRCELIGQLERGTPFVCVCGVEGDPNDPEYARIHQEHVCVWGLDRLTGC